MKQTSYTVAEAKSRMEAYCAYQERCHQEVRQKLRAMGMIPLAIDDVIAHLITQGFLNEQRFAQSFVRGKFRIKKWGRLRIEQALKMHGLSDYIIQEAMQEIDDVEYEELLLQLAEKKQAAINEKNPYKAKAKLVRFLLYKGFEPDLVFNIAADLCSCD